MLKKTVHIVLIMMVTVMMIMVTKIPIKFIIFSHLI